MNHMSTCLTTQKVVIKVVPVDWEYKEIKTCLNGPAEEQIHEEGDCDFFD